MAVSAGLIKCVVIVFEHGRNAVLPGRNTPYPFDKLMAGGIYYKLRSYSPACSFRLGGSARAESPPAGEF